MRLTVFQAGKGDCLLLTGRDGTNVLVDGGMRDDYRTHVAGALGRLGEEGQRLELVYVSHIDQDHISGVLQLLDDVVAWRVFDFQQSRGNSRFAQPDRPRPPAIANVWYNGFREQVRDNAGEIEELLAAKASVLAASHDAEDRDRAPAHSELAASIPEGLELSRRIGPEQLGIPLNKQFRGRLALVREGARPVRLGGMTFSVIGPFSRDLDALRGKWDTWLREHREQLANLRRRMARDAGRLASGDVASLNAPLALAAGELGNRARVTVPNLASLMLHVKEGRRAMLLTGDGHAREILKGLEKTGKLDRDGRIHVDVLKVQHHGAEHNTDPAFLERVSADTYVFCGNGEHENPDLRVVRAVIDSRLGPGATGERGRRAGPFALRFNSSSRSAPRARERGHMRQVEEIVGSAERDSGGRLSSAFLDDSSFTLEVA